MINLTDIIKKLPTLSDEDKRKFFYGPFLLISMDSIEIPVGETQVMGFDDILEFDGPGSKMAGKMVIPLSGKTHMKIGREDVSHIKLPDSSVSRNHATLTKMPDGNYLITDLESANGTTVNGDSVGAMEAVTLHNRDQILIGSVEAVFYNGRTFKGMVTEVLERLKARKK